jgi:serine phosphatase RsbU (regulator of sigma subunit)
MAETYETLLYHQKQALKTWKSLLGPAVTTVSPDIEKLVWELLILCAENFKKPSLDTDDEIMEVARALAVNVLKSSDVRTLYSAYRDNLIEAVLQVVPEGHQYAKPMVHFSNVISDAYREAYADRLRRLITNQRASRLSEELMLAKRIQERLLPKTIPHIPGFQIAGKVVPAREVGGDYWSAKYYEEDGVVTMKLADITGHGIAAATLVAAVKFISGGYYRGATSAHEVIERTNHILVRETPIEILVTMVYGWLHPDTREVEIVNAGHEPVFLCKEGLCIDIRPTGPILGISDTNYGEHRLKMEPGDILFFCSDGITEAGTSEQFGTARVKTIVLSNRHKSADEIVDAIIQAVIEFAGQPHDDMSLVVVKAVGDEAA